MQSSVETDSARVLVVDDERDVADLYAAWLETDHEALTAYSGPEAVDLLGKDPDVVLLDRQMPTLSGDEVLERIDHSPVDPHVVMVTAVDPDFDIVEMPFDDYLTKPVRREQLLSAVDEMLRRSTYDDRMQRYFECASKKATLESEKSRAELEESREYAEISRRVEQLRERADAAVSEFDDFEAAFQELP